MKKLLYIFLTLAFVSTAMAQDTTPGMLKQRKFFDKPELYEALSIYSNREANAELIREYEAKPAEFKPEQLMPVVSCYMAFNNIPAAKKTLELFLVARPNNQRALRTMGTLCLLSNDHQGAIDNFKKAYESGDKTALKSLASAYLLAKQPAALKSYIDSLKEMAKKDLEALNIVLIYAEGDKNTQDEAMFKEVLSSVDTREILRGASMDGLSAILRIYLAKRDLWPATALAIPARAAALGELWLPALQAYEKALEANPKDIMALRGVSLVYYRTGDVQRAIDSIKAAMAAGDKEAASDGVELAIITARQDIWDQFKEAAKSIKINPAVRAGMVQFSNSRDGYADMFFMACEGEGSEPLFKDAGVMELIANGLKKYGTDPRAAALKSKYDEAAKTLPKKS